jgi:hypothetical protein
MTSWNIDFYAIDQSQETCTDFDTLYEYTLFIWPSFVYHSRLTICDCLRFTKVCFCPYTSEKQFVWMTLIPVLCHVSTKISIFVLLVCSKLAWHNVVARHFGCRCNTILYLWRQDKAGTSAKSIPDVKSHCKKHPRITTDPLEQSAIDFVNITSGQDVPQSV